MTMREHIEDRLRMRVLILLMVEGLQLCLDAAIYDLPTWERADKSRIPL